MKKCHTIAGKILLLMTVVVGLLYGLVVTCFHEEVVDWKARRLRAALMKANPKWNGSYEDFGIEGTRIIGMNLRRKSISDLTPLKGMSLTWLCVSNTDVVDLTPLGSMPLAKLSVAQTGVADLTPLSPNYSRRPRH